jgi:hypothetical protein
MDSGRDVLGSNFIHPLRHFNDAQRINAVQYLLGLSCNDIGMDRNAHGRRWSTFNVYRSVDFVHESAQRERLSP